MNIILYILLLQLEISIVSIPTTGIAKSGVIIPIGATLNIDDSAPEIKTINAILL